MVRSASSEVGIFANVLELVKWVVWKMEPRPHRTLTIYFVPTRSVNTAAPSCWPRCIISAERRFRCLHVSNFAQIIGGLRRLLDVFLVLSLAYSEQSFIRFHVRANSTGHTTVLWYVQDLKMR